MIDGSASPRGASGWPAWFAAAGFVLALGASLLLAAVAAVVAVVVTGDTTADGPGYVLAATLLQDAAFVGVAVWLAARVGSVAPADFGLRRVPLSRAIGWTLALGAAFYVFAGAYSLLLSPDGEQETLDALGADEGIVLLVVSAVVVVVLAPFVEELLFRGFLYRSLRNRLPPLRAALVIGVAFGSVHYSGGETLELLPVLAVLGAVFCLAYEKTGSLYPAIALHAVNNGIALAATADTAHAVPVAMVVLALSLTLWGVLLVRSPAVPHPPIRPGPPTHQPWKAEAG